MGAAYTRAESGDSADPITEEEIAAMFSYGSDFDIPEDDVFDIDDQENVEQEQTQSVGSPDEDVTQTADEPNTADSSRRQSAYDKLMNGELR